MAGYGGQDALVRLAREPIRPVYLIEGQEAVLIDAAIDLLVDRVLPEAQRDFNLDRMSGQNADVRRIIDTAQTFPAFATHRCLVVRQAHLLTWDSKGPLAVYLESPSETSVLIFCGDKFDARSRSIQKAKKAGFHFPLEAPKPRQLPGVLARYAKKHEIQISQRAVQAVAEASPSLSASVQNLKMLALYAADREIGEDDVCAVLQSAKEESVFDLVDAVGRGDRGQSFAMLDRLVRHSGAAPLRVLHMLARHYRSLLRAAEARRLNMDRAATAKHVGGPPFLLERLRTQSARYAVSDLTGALEAIQRTDVGLKGGALDPLRGLERLVLRLLRD